MSVYIKMVTRKPLKERYGVFLCIQNLEYWFRLSVTNTENLRNFGVITDSFNVVGIGSIENLSTEI
jgi:hypothetical protein